MLDTREIERALAGTIKLMKRDSAGLYRFDRTTEGFWRSFWAILLVLPAFVLQVAGQWQFFAAHRPQAVPDHTWLLINECAALVAYWLLFPAAVLVIARLVGRETRFYAYITAANWSSVITTAVLAAPMALYLAGWATPAHAVIFTFAFVVLMAHFRWYLAKTALEVSGGVAALIVAIEAGLAILVVQPAAFAMAFG